MTHPVEEKYLARTPKSRSMFERAQRTLPGGVAGNGKFLPPYPAYLTQAKGAELVDVDGNRYVDLLMGAGAHILGHSPDCVQQAVQAQLANGLIHLYMPAEAEVKLAEKICQLMKPVERVRFVNSGSEATMTVMRAVRAYRKRDIIVKFEGAWHGLHDGVLVSTLGVEGEPHAPIAHLDCAGIPKEIARHLLILPYNEADLAAETISQHADEIAGVMVEPASGFGIGVVAGELEFLKAVREVTARYEIPLIFDEVVTNFRLALGGATEFFGVQPDLVTLGKIPGGGFAFGGYGGRQDIMEAMIAPKDGKWDFSRQVIQSGTFSGNPITTAAGLAILEELERRQDQIYPQLAKDTRELGAAIQQLADRLGFDVHVNRVASIFQVHFGTPGIRNKRDLLRADKKTADLFHLGLRAHGVMASYHPVFLSTAHTAAHHQQILEAAEQSFKLMKSAG